MFVDAMQIHDTKKNIFGSFSKQAFAEYLSHISF